MYSLCSLGDSGKVTTVVATVGQGPERSQEVAYTDIKVIGNGSFGVVYQEWLADTRELVAIKKVLQDKRFKYRELQIMCKLDHCNIVRLQYFFYSSGEKVRHWESEVCSPPRCDAIHFPACLSQKVLCVPYCSFPP